MVNINGISNSDGYLGWDTTTPNSTTRARLRRILDDAVLDAAAFGIYVVTRHNDCGRRGHHKSVDAHGYITSDPYGLGIKYRDPRFVWNRDQLFTGQRYCACPCSQSVEAVDHCVLEDFAHSHDTDANLFQSIANILSDIQSAINEAGDKKPRSGIREYLLRAVLVLNDAIMPATVEVHIAAAMEKA